MSLSAGPEAIGGPTGHTGGYDAFLFSFSTCASPDICLAPWYPRPFDPQRKRTPARKRGKIASDSCGDSCGLRLRDERRLLQVRLARAVGGQWAGDSKSAWRGQWAGATPNPPGAGSGPATRQGQTVMALRRGLSETAEQLDLDVAFMRCETNQHHGDRGPVPQRHAVVDQLRSNASRTDNVDFPASVPTTVPRLRCTCGLRCL